MLSWFSRLGSSDWLAQVCFIVTAISFLMLYLFSIKCCLINQHVTRSCDRKTIIQLSLIFVNVSFSDFVPFDLSAAPRS